MADADPFAQYVGSGQEAPAAPPASASADGDPFAQYVGGAAPGGDNTPPPQQPAPSDGFADRFMRASGRVVDAAIAGGEDIYNTVRHPVEIGKELASKAADVGKGIYHGLSNASQFATNAALHPVDTANAIKQNPGANFREVMRGVNSNIPGGNTLVDTLDQFRAAHGGPAAPDAAADQRAALPGAQEFGGVAGAPLGTMVGGIAAKGIEAAAPAAANFVKAWGRAAEERQAARGLEHLEEKTYKRTRAGIRQGNVEAAVEENPELRNAAASKSDSAVAKATGVMRQRAGAELDRIYSSTTPMVESMTTPIDNMDARIAKLREGTSSERKVADKLQEIRDELNKNLKPEDALNPKRLRAEQSDYQKKAYGKALPGDEPATISIAANAEAQKAVGDAVVQYVTGMDYNAAKAYAATNPDSVAARLFKANDEISAANRIEAGIADRAGRAQPEQGFAAKLKHAVAHATIPAAIGSGFGAHGGIIGGLVGATVPEIPRAARAIARAKDAAIAARAPGIASAIAAAPDTLMARNILELMRRGVPRDAAIRAARGLSPSAAPSLVPAETP